jgi:hypothetical protein
MWKPKCPKNYGNKYYIMKNIKHKINFRLQREKILYYIMDCVEDETWRRVNTDLSLLVRRANSPVCQEVVDNVKKQIV